MKNNKTNTFIEKANKVHNDFYNYDKTEYENSKQKVIITCPIHGDFEQTLNKHLIGQGCPKCGRDRINASNKMSQSEFITAANAVHNNKYDYSESNYVGSRTKILINCSLHGGFWQEPSAHLQGQGCPCCGNQSRVALRKMSLDEFKDKASKVHNNFYDYSKVHFNSLRDKITIVCPKHGEFVQSASNHLQGQNCPNCAIEHRTKLRTKDFSESLNKMQIAHNNKYVYDESTYTGTKNKMKIICPEHGEFWQTPYNHYNGQGCPKCSYVYRSKIFKKSLDDFIKEANKIHNSKYDYSKSEYITTMDKICIICPKHGEFWQTPNEHLQGHGCPKCILKSQSVLFENIKAKFPNLVLEWEYNPNWLGNQRFDIYCAKYNFAIEYNGIQHYQPVTHFGGEERFAKQQIDDNRKRKLCNENNCRLFEIKYDYKQEDLDLLYNSIKNIIDYED